MFSKYEIQLHSDWGTTWNIEHGTYPDGSPMVKLDSPGADIDTLILRPKSLAAFHAGLYLADAFEERGRKIRNLLIPFIPGGRQDRLNPTGDFLFTLKSVARDINARNFDQVVTLDPHSNVTPALINRMRAYPLSELLSNYWSGYDAVIAPDAGAIHRAEEVGRILGKPVVQASKTRDVTTGKLSGFEVTVEADKNYLVFDDICDGGGTFLGLGEEIIKQGADAGLYVSHGIFSKGTVELNSMFKHVSTTDSTVFDKPNVTTKETTQRMLQWMR